MSNKDYSDEDSDYEYSDEIGDIELAETYRIKPRHNARRQIENLLERKRLRKMIAMDDDYWADE